MEVATTKAMLNIKAAKQKRNLDIYSMFLTRPEKTGLYEGWNFNSGSYLFTTDTQ